MHGLAALLPLAASLPALAQCPGQWLPGLGLAGTTDTVSCCKVWDPDGPGPAPAKLVVGGNMAVAGDQRVHGLATWDGAAWGTLGPISGPGSMSLVNDIVVTPDGRLFVSGTYGRPDGDSQFAIACWNGAAWTLVGSPEENRRTFLLAASPAGDLYTLTLDVRPDGITTGVARWNGAAWIDLPGRLEGYATDLAISPAGDPHIAGRMRFPGAATFDQGLLAFLDGRWSPVGGARGDGAHLAFLPDGRLLTIGTYQLPGLAGVHNLVSWDGANWSDVTGLAGSWSVGGLDSLPDGRIALTGNFDLVTGEHALALWNGASLTGLRSSTGTGFITTCAALWTDGRVIVAGQNDTFYSPRPFRGIAKHTGTDWAPLTPGAAGRALALAPTPDGGYILAGLFPALPGTSSASICRVGPDGQRSGFGAGIRRGDPPTISAVAVAPNGDVIAAGDFNINGRPGIYNIARWNGSAWTALGVGIPGAPVTRLAALPDGRIVAAGEFQAAGGVPANRLAIWNGASWASMNALADGPVNALLALPDGRLMAAGAFSRIAPDGPSCAGLWDGAWHSLPGIGGTVYDLALAPDGAVFAAGAISAVDHGRRTVDGVAWWDGVWHGYGELPSWLRGIGRIAVLPSGVPVCTESQGPNLIRWENGGWLENRAQFSGFDDLAVAADGRLLAAGAFTHGDDAVSCMVATLGDLHTPAVLREPDEARGSLGAEVSFSAEAAPEEPFVSYLWRRDGVPISWWENHTVGNPTLTIRPLTIGDRGDYDCLIRTLCGSTITRRVRLTVCVADFNADGLIDFFDLLDFGDAFAAGDDVADVNRDAFIDFFDYVGFVAEFEAGC